MRKKIFSIWSVLLVLVISIAVLVPGCTDGGAVQYDLTIGSTAGGTTAPGEGTHTYDDGEVVDLVATPDCGYVFDYWSGDTGTIDDVNAAATNITMNADYDINANFKLIPPDHYKFYDVYSEDPVSIGAEVLLEDQFGKFTATVMNAMTFGNPVAKDHPGMPLTPIYDPDRHYTMYWLDISEADWVRQSVEVSNQFNDAAEPQTLTVLGPVALAVPTQKVVPGDHEMVECLNHYLLYWVVEEPEALEVGVNLNDQFIPDGEDVTVYEPLMFANPVQKTVVGVSGDVAEIENEDLHWVLYNIGEGQPTSIDKTIRINNQFGDDQTLDLTYRDLLAVPSQKNVPPTPPLDHFKCYQIPPPQSALQLGVNLLDQFHDNYFDGVVDTPMMFCNPVKKVHDGVTISSNPDNHLTVYKLTDTPTDDWIVTVKNQFGDNQELIVSGPVALAVPTQKLVPGDHGLPKYLDHYLLYSVLPTAPVDVNVDLDDQFDGVAENVTVGMPVYFANPALKGYIDHTGIWDPEEHLVFYAISDNPEFYDYNVVIKNQFAWEVPAELDLDTVGQLLAVPSEKLNWASWEPTG